MSTLTGILVDVSDSMRESVGDGVDEEGGNWATSIFKVVDELIKHNVSSSNQTFALAFGSPSHPTVYDLLSTVEKAQPDQSSIKDLRSKRSKRSMIDEALTILETNGAPRVRNWAKMDVLLNVVDDTSAAAILHFLQKSPDFTKKFVYECLPEESREFASQNIVKEGLFFLAGWIPFIGSKLQAWATEDSVRDAIRKGKKASAEIVGVSDAAIRTVHSASEILHAGFRDQELTNKRADELLKAVEPFIYGLQTPLIQAMRDSVDLFSKLEYVNHQKMLFILSGSEPTDGTDPPLKALSDLGVTTVSCFIKDQSLSDPRHLYSILDNSWEEPAKFMFGVSSTITAQKIPRTLFVKRGWKIDINNNETRLFYQVNNPEIIKDVCDMAKEGVFSQDALSDKLPSAELEIYVNQVKKGSKVEEQFRKTCYANACAAVLHLAMRSIIGRDGGYPDFFEIRRELTAYFREPGARTIKVLKAICSTYRLQCQEVDVIGAMKAISEKRPVVASFKLTGEQWDNFYQFYEKNPKGILTRSELDSKSHTSGQSRVHAVVLTSYDGESLRLMNSWGDGWADNGFFRVQNSDVLGLKFVDVFWDLDNLSEEEQRAYDQHGAKAAAKLMKSLKGIQVAKHKCPFCAVKSLVVDYSGHLLKAKCPKCRRTLNAYVTGGDLALNLYLTSLLVTAEDQTCSQCSKMRLSTLTGILVDVSGSMRNSVGDGVDVEGGPWARSIFKVVDEVIKHDVSSSNQTFALAFGSPSCVKVFDLFSTIQKAQRDHDIYQSSIKALRSKISKESMIDEALAILERNGAPRVRTWGKIDVLLKVVDESAAAAILYFLRKSSHFVTNFVFNCLPEECRALRLHNVIHEGLFYLAGHVPRFGENLQAAGTENSVKEAIEKGNQLVAETIKASVEMVGVSNAAIRSVHDASEILHASIDDKELTDERVDEILKVVEPYIYGQTPLIQAMHDSVDLFSNPEFANHQKVLFILSDGQPSDGNDPPLKELSDLAVTTVSCFITDQSLSDPRHLYSILNKRWEEPAKLMFRMSSTITTQKIPRTLFVKKGWKIDIDNNEIRLFFQVNNPEIIKDVCDMAKKGVLSQDALSDILSSVDLDIYVNQVNEGLKAEKQQGKTCYANACAAVLHMAMKSIIDRDGGCPDFFELRRNLIANFGVQGAPTIKVLKKICPTYRLQCKEVDAIGAMKAISEKRPVVARFTLTGAQWDQFYKFYEENPKGILARSDLDSNSHSTGRTRGHAVVLTSYDAESFRLMNSRGDGWADNGFFRVQNSDVLGLRFMDVFWTLEDLSDKEKRAYDQHGAEVAAKLMKSLKGIQMAKYECPLCAVESLLVKYSGHLLKAKCPRCGGTFNANEVGGDLALNLYLTSLLIPAKAQTSPQCSRMRYKVLQP